MPKYKNMKLNTLLEELLLEAKRVDFLRSNEKNIYDKWQELSEKDELGDKERAWCERSVPISDDLFNKMVEASEKYLGWIIGVYKREFTISKFYTDNSLIKPQMFAPNEIRFAEDLYKYKYKYKYKNDITIFDSKDGAVSRKLPKKSIDLYANQKELHKALEEHGFIKGIESLNMREVQQQTLVFKGDVFDVYVPTTKDQSCVLGANTDWCTAYPEEKHNQFDNYNSQGKLYILINRSNPTEKYQFHFESEQFMDKNGDEIDEESFYISDKKLMSFFYETTVFGDNSNIVKNKTTKKNYLFNIDEKELYSFSNAGRHFFEQIRNDEQLKHWYMRDMKIFETEKFKVYDCVNFYQIGVLLKNGINHLNFKKYVNKHTYFIENKEDDNESYIYDGTNKLIDENGYSLLNFDTKTKDVSLQLMLFNSPINESNQFIRFHHTNHFTDLTIASFLKNVKNKNAVRNINLENGNLTQIPDLRDFTNLEFFTVINQKLLNLNFLKYNTTIESVTLHNCGVEKEEIVKIEKYVNEKRRSLNLDEIDFQY